MLNTYFLIPVNWKTRLVKTHFLDCKRNKLEMELCPVKMAVITNKMIVVVKVIKMVEIENEVCLQCRLKM